MNRDFDDLISRFLASEATPEEIERLDNWLAEDESHIRYFFRSKNLYDVNHPAFPRLTKEGLIERLILDGINVG